MFRFIFNIKELNRRLNNQSESIKDYQAEKELMRNFIDKVARLDIDKKEDIKLLKVEASYIYGVVGDI